MLTTRWAYPANGWKLLPQRAQLHRFRGSTSGPRRCLRDRSAPAAVQTWRLSAAAGRLLRGLPPRVRRDLHRAGAGDRRRWSSSPTRPSLKRALRRRPGQHGSLPGRNIILGPLLGPRSLLLIEGEQHLSRRKLMLPPFHGERMRAYEDVDARGDRARDRALAARQAVPAAPLDAGDHAGRDPQRGLRRHRRSPGSGAQQEPDRHPHDHAVAAGDRLRDDDPAPARPLSRHRADDRPRRRAAGSRDRRAPRRPRPRRARRHPLAARRAPATRTAREWTTASCATS